jgi:hypothetical protein
MVACGCIIRGSVSREPAVDRRRLLHAAWVACFATLSARAHAAGPGDVAGADARRVRAVVQAQLDAFAAGDAARAFVYAAPPIREMFGTPERFMEMVERRYAPVIRPASVAFLATQVSGDTAIQGVHLTDAAGDVWLAVYRLERQPDRNWRITACELQESTARTT